MTQRGLAYSEALLVQVSIFVKSLSRKVRCAIYCQGTGFKNVKSNNYVLSSLEEISMILEEGYGLSSSNRLEVEFPQAGEGYVKTGDHYCCLETFSDSDRSGRKQKAI